jgi:hypothetical protein
MFRQPHNAAADRALKRLVHRDAPLGLALAAPHGTSEQIAAGDPTSSAPVIGE